MKCNACGSDTREWISVQTNCHIDGKMDFPCSRSLTAFLSPPHLRHSSLPALQYAFVFLFLVLARRTNSGREQDVGLSHAQRLFINQGDINPAILIGNDAQVSTSVFVCERVDEGVGRDKNTSYFGPQLLKTHAHTHM